MPLSYFSSGSSTAASGWKRLSQCSLYGRPSSQSRSSRHPRHSRYCRYCRYVPALLAALLTCVGTAHAQGGAPGASATASRVMFTTGEASLRRPGQTAAPLTNQLVLRAGDSVATGATGRAQLLLAGGTRMALQPATEVQLPADASSESLRFNAGSLRVSMAEAGDFRIATLRGVVRVRGASFSAAYNADGTLNIASEREPVEVCTAAGCVTAADDNLRIRGDSLLPTRTNARATWK